MAFSRDETVMGFGFPKEERAAMVAVRARQVHAAAQVGDAIQLDLVRLDAIDLEELRELVIDGWRMCVPKSVSATVP